MKSIIFNEKNKLTIFLECLSHIKIAIQYNEYHNTKHQDVNKKLPLLVLLLILLLLFYLKGVKSSLLDAYLLTSRFSSLPLSVCDSINKKKKKKN